ncbi:unnamed protein product [Coccothraustes coccothraustes]
MAGVGVSCSTSRLALHTDPTLLSTAARQGTIRLRTATTGSFPPHTAGWRGISPRAALSRLPGACAGRTDAFNGSASTVSNYTNRSHGRSCPFAFTSATGTITFSSPPCGHVDPPHFRRMERRELGAPLPHRWVFFPHTAGGDGATASAAKGCSQFRASGRLPRAGTHNQPLFPAACSWFVGSGACSAGRRSPPPPAPPPPTGPAPIRDVSYNAGEDPQPTSPLPAGPPPVASLGLPGNTDSDSGEHQQPVPQRGRALAAGGRPHRAAKSEDQRFSGTSTFPGTGALAVPRSAGVFAETSAAWWGRAVEEKVGVARSSWSGSGLSQGLQVQGPQMIPVQSWEKGTSQMNLG